MKKIYENEYMLRMSDFDKYNRIKPSAVLELFQDVAGQHANEIGVGYDEMMRRSYFWVIVRIKFKIISNPLSNQKIIVKTWPLQPTKLYYRREFSINDESGNSLIVGSSEWVVVHSEKRRFVSDPNLYSFEDGFCTEKMFEDKIFKVPDFEMTGEHRLICPGFSDIDVNNHVNNTKYANYVTDAISPSQDDVLEMFQIDYRKEVVEGNNLHLYHVREGNTSLAKGVNDNGDIMFACKLEYKQGVKND